MSTMTSQPSLPRRSFSGLSILAKLRNNKDSKPSRSLEGSGVNSRRHNIGPRDDFVVGVRSLEDEFVSASKIGRRKEIGKGASATVRIMQRKKVNKGEDSTLYAVKEFRNKTAKETEEEYIRKVKSEYIIAKSLNHPNVVQTIQLCTSNGRWNHVMEYCQQGELFGLIERKYLKPADRNCIFKQVLRGVGYLHDQGIAHRDIKLENLLMTAEGYVKITDFGISEAFCGQHPGVSSSRGLCGHSRRDLTKSRPSVCGSRPYMSPEVLAQDKDYDPTKLDVWSCGILFITMTFSGSPWQSPSKDEGSYSRFSEGWNAYLDRFGSAPINENCHPQCGPLFSALSSDSVRRCILKMLHPDPHRRCSINDALNDRWVKGIECCSREDTESTLETIDVSKTGCHRVAARMKVQPKHDHLPPPIKRLPQHRFDMGDGTSRYD